MLVVAGDNLFDFSLADYVDFWRSKDGSAIAVYEQPEPRARQRVQRRRARHRRPRRRLRGEARAARVEPHRDRDLPLPPRAPRAAARVPRGGQSRPTSRATSSPGSTRARRSTATASAASGSTSATARSCSRRTTATAGARACPSGTSTRSNRPFGLFRIGRSRSIMRAWCCAPRPRDDRDVGLARASARLERLLARSVTSGHARGPTVGSCSSCCCRSAASRADAAAPSSATRASSRCRASAAALRALRQPDRVARAPLRGVLRPARSRSRRRAPRSPTTSASARSSPGWKEHGLRRLAATAADVVVAALARPDGGRADVRPARPRPPAPARPPPGRAPRARARPSAGSCPCSTLLSRTRRGAAPARREPRRAAPQRPRRVRGRGQRAAVGLPRRRRLHVRRDGVRGGVGAPAGRARARCAVVTFARALRLR